MAFNRDGSLLASGSKDDSVKIWDVASGYLQNTLTDQRFFSAVFRATGLLASNAKVDELSVENLGGSTK